MSLPFTITILVIGLILLALEIVVLPGGVAGVLGLGIIVFSIWSTFVNYGTAYGTWMLVIAMLVCVVLLFIFLKSKTWKRFSLKEESDSRVNQIDRQTIQIGAHGRTIARLAPTGKAIFGNEQVEVHAINQFIDPDRPIEVVAIEGYRIDVKEIDDDRF